MRINIPPRERLANQRSALLGRFRFITDIIAELRKVSWPSREETKRLTTMVVIVSVAMGVLLGIVDEAFSIMANALFF
ncbi:MAG: preprotein translocase subunit SecE [Dehalococcoidia bacterium]